MQFNDLPSGVFKAHEPVIRVTPAVAGARVPRFGNAVEWNLNGSHPPTGEPAGVGLDRGVLR